MKTKWIDGIAFLVAAIIFAGFIAEAAHDGIGISGFTIRKVALVDADLLALTCAVGSLFNLSG